MSIEKKNKSDFRVIDQLRDLGLRENVSLQNYNTFGIDVKGRYFIDIDSVSALKTALDYGGAKFILGGGSNVLFTKDIDALILRMNIKGMEVVERDDEKVAVKVYAGEIWHMFVLWCIKHNFGGLENLSLIPGSVGAAPVQNIGAYGVEIKDCIEQVDAVNIITKDVRTFSNNDCMFGYRSSVFNTTLRGEYVVVSVTFGSTVKNHMLWTVYGCIADELVRRNIVDDPNIKDISDIVIDIRRHKLPDYREIGNAGSFFKNAVVSDELFKQIRKNHPEIPSFLSTIGVKIPAGWLIEKAGWKGRSVGNTGVYQKHALILVNHGGALGSDVLHLSRLIQKSVYEMFGITLVTEVQIM